jgi:very-short-patch-repair endonuclease
MIAHRLDTGEWERFLPGVYRLAGVPETWDQRLLAVCLWLDGRCVVSHRAAGAIWGLDDCERDVIEVTTVGRVTPPLWLVVHRTKSFPQHDRTTHGLFPITSPTRTLIDLAAVVDEEALEVAFDSALRKGLTSVDYCVRRIDRLGSRGRTRAGALREIAELRRSGGHTKSAMETKTWRRIRLAGFPSPVRNFVVRVEERTRKIDLAWPNLRVGVEYHSDEQHSSLRARHGDLVRNDELVALGWRILYVTGEMVRNPERFLALLGETLRIAARERAGNV